MLYIACLVCISYFVNEMRSDWLVDQLDGWTHELMFESMLGWSKVHMLRWINEWLVELPVGRAGQAYTIPLYTASGEFSQWWGLFWLGLLVIVAILLALWQVHCRVSLHSMEWSHFTNWHGLTSLNLTGQARPGKGTGVFTPNVMPRAWEGRR